MENAPVWVLYDEKIGSTHQCLGLAQRLGVPFELKKVALKAPWSKRGPQFHPVDLKIIDPAASDDLGGPLPKMIIASGSKLAAPALALKAATGGEALAIQIHDPVAKRGQFDAIVVPNHDARQHPKFIKIKAALTVTDDQRLDQGRSILAPILSGLTGPHIGVMIGGPNRAFGFPDKDVSYLIAPLKQLLSQTSGSLLLCPSRRTPDGVLDALQKAFAAEPRVWIWDRVSENPYFGILAACDRLLVTQDSVNMVTEAVCAGHPVTMLPLPRKGLYRLLRSKFDRFHDLMIAEGFARHWQGQLESWQPPQLDDAGLVIEELKRRFDKRLSFLTESQ